MSAVPPVSSVSVFQEEPGDFSGVPEEYHDLWGVFSRSRATSLPPHRPYDCSIDLLPGTTPPRGGLYFLSGTGIRYHLYCRVFYAALQRFLGFANFYRHFSRNFFQVTALLTALNSTKSWPILSQRSPHDDKVHPWAFFSHRLSPEELNYDVGNHELLAIRLTLGE